MDPFGPATSRWFESAFDAATPVQAQGWRAIARREHSLLIAPTGSGKTLAAFLYCIDRLARRTEANVPGVRTLYVSPLRALVYDVERNLRVPLAGIAQAAARVGETVRMPSVAIRTGDTPARDRQRQLREPGEILVTTPESLYLLLIGQARETLHTVDTVIVDEVHALAPGKRGAHLAISLERLAELCAIDPQRIGLSATAKPLEEVASFLGGDRPVTIIDTSSKPHIDLQITVPVPDMTRPSEGLEPRARPSGDRDATLASDSEFAAAPPAMFEPVDNSIWPAIYPKLLGLILAHRTTIVFVNSRGLCERLAQRLREESGDPDLVRAHHGSVARAQREVIEEQLKAGQIKAIVATSSLELGIDMGAVDLVVLVESPGAVSRGLQRIGRAGHSVGEISKGRLFPKHRGDLLEATVVGRRMQRGEIEALSFIRNPLDVLAQQIVAMCTVEPWQVSELARVIRRAANFAELPQDAFIGVLDMLAGRYPSHAFADLRPRIVWDRDTDTLGSRRGSKQVAVFNGGTIPDRGTYGVFLGVEGPRVGELDEEMVHESAAGQRITLGASTWRIEQITRDRVIVTPAPGETGRLPFWRGDGPGRPAELGRAMGKFTSDLVAKSRDDGATWLVSEWGLDAWAAQNLVDYVHEQRDATGTVPSDAAITIERFRDELGDWRVCILSPLGARVNAPWALAIQAQLERHFGFEVQALWSDDGIVLRLVEIEEFPPLELLLPDPEDVRELVVEQLAHAALFAGQFRENAARSLLLPKPRANARTPLWQQRLKAQQLLAVAQDFPSFPIIIETYRACLRDVFDLPALQSFLRSIATREIRVEEVETSSASPFSRSLAFAYVAAFLYEGDAPLAERKAQALTLDRKLLRELLGVEELRELLDPEAIDELQAELQALAPEYRATHHDGLHDVLRRTGDHSAPEIDDRCEPRLQAEAWLDILVRERRAIPLRVGGEPRFVAVEDVALYRDALGCVPPPGVPHAYLERSEHPWTTLVARFARTHGPFGAQAVADRFAVPIGQAQAALQELVHTTEVVAGSFRDGDALQYCNAEVLRRIKRRTLARLRGEIAPVEPAALVRFLPQWHGLGGRLRGMNRLREVLVQLEGLPLPFGELERSILPRRVVDFAPPMLDELGALGWLVWVGHGSLGKTDGRVALYRRERVAMLVDVPLVPEDLSPIHRALLDHLERRGACFYIELQTACVAHGHAEEIREALWDLVWRGLVTNDTCAALRSYGAPRRPSRRGRYGEGPNALGGRWSLVSELVGLAAPAPITATERMHALAVTLLERHGVVSREVALLEPVVGGFSAVYPVLKAMEEAGKIRRGYFVEGLGGAQFASPGAVDRIRGARGHQVDGEALALSAVDPANPFGWLLPWPLRDDKQATPRRAAGATVVVLHGEAVLYLDRSGKRMTTFPAADDPEVARAAAAALRAVAVARRGKSLRIELIDGQPARTSVLGKRLAGDTFHSDPRGLLIEA